MNPLSLESLQKHRAVLETSLDSTECWIAIATAVVVLGLIFEYWFEVQELINEFRTSARFPWKRLLELVGGVLVTVGVVGELGFQFSASKAGAMVRADGHQIEGLLNAEAGKGREEAASANKKAEQLRCFNLVLEAKLLELREQMKWRSLSTAQRNVICPAVGTQFADHFVVSSPPGDTEALRYAKQFVAEFKRCDEAAGLPSTQRYPGYSAGPPNSELLVGLTMQVAEDAPPELARRAELLRKQLVRNGLKIGAIRRTGRVIIGNYVLPVILGSDSFPLQEGGLQGQRN